MLSYETIEPHTLELLKRIMSEPFFNGMRLVGGTALALQYGHRQSIDLDLFGTLPEDLDVYIFKINSMEAGLYQENNKPCFV